MNRLKDKVVFITGASSGIGKSCAELYAENGAHVILTARRLERIQDLAKSLTEKHGIQAFPIQMDVTDKTSIQSAIDSLPEDLSTIDILVNNAGLALGTETIQEGITDNWDTMIDTNIKGLLYVTKAILPNMVKRDSGHIVNVSSIAGYDYYKLGNVYCATKHAVKAISHSLRLDLFGTKIRVSDIGPGATETEFSNVRWKDDAKADAFYADFDPLTPTDIAETIIFCTSRPEHVNVSNLVVFPTDQAAVYMINKGGSAGGIG